MDHTLEKKYFQQYLAYISFIIILLSIKLGNSLEKKKKSDK